MAELRLEYSAESATRTLDANMQKAAARSRKAMAALAQEAADEIRERGIADIKRAGSYGSDWTSGLHTVVEDTGDGALIQVSHSKPYFNFLNQGGVIKGSPLLWIPTENVDGHIPASEYPGRLIRTKAKSGLPLLIDPNIESSRAGWRTGEVMYIGEQFVIMPQKFHILEIIRDVARGLKSKYKFAYSTSG